MRSRSDADPVTPEPGGVPAEWEEIDLAVQLAHDVRSPISAVVALAGSLREELADMASDLQRHQLNLIYNAALQLDSLVSDLIELNRSPEELTRADPVPFSVDDVLSGIRDMLNPLAELTGAPVAVRGLEVDRRIGYPSAISRVLFNLAAPALRSGGRGPVNLEAEVLDEPLVRFSVHHPDPALTSEAVGRVRAVALEGRPRDRSCFSHLGLELSFYLTRILGSDLEVEFSDALGVRFSFALPLPPA